MRMYLDLVLLMTLLVVGDDGIKRVKSDEGESGGMTLYVGSECGGWLESASLISWQGGQDTALLR